LSWSQYKLLIRIDNQDKRDFYIAETVKNNWTVRQLERQIYSSLYERLLLSNDKESVLAVAKNKKQPSDGKEIIKDPMFLEFLGLKREASYYERDLENAIITHLQEFLLELGNGFSFVARQKRIHLDGDEFQPYHIRLFHSLFKGRDDVFAIHWEKSGKSGYVPAYQYDLYHYRIHKMNGGVFQNYPHKTYLPLTETEIQKHLNGVQQIGIYPLLQNNTSWFLVADFDKQNWKEEGLTFLNACKEKNIPAYLERSRSGSGGYVTSKMNFAMENELPLSRNGKSTLMRFTFF